MSVRALRGDDWVFGQGRANYLTKSQEIAQNVKTRLRSFKKNWFLDTDANIDWFAILGNYDNEKTIKREVERVTLETLGVKSIESIDIVTDESRKATISLAYTDIFNESFTSEIGLT